MTTPQFRIQAWRTTLTDPTTIQPTEIDDPIAEYFEVKHPDMYGRGVTFETLGQAKDVMHALENVFEMGQKKYQSDLRVFLGAADR